MAGLHDFTTKEVLNKVLLDSSGNAVAAYSHTSQEALNAVLDSANSRLNVSLVGGTISGDVTISGDLTVEGDSYANVSETVQGDMIITSSSSSDSKPLFQFINTDTSNNYGGELQFYKNAAAGSDNDQLGKIVFYGNNTAGTPEKTNFASIFAYSADVSDGTEDGWLRIRTIAGGTNTDTLTLKSGRVAVGHTSPSYNLDVQNAEGTYIAKFTAGWSSGSGIWVSAGSQGHGYGQSTHLLRMDNQMSGGTRVFHIKSDGRVAINTAISNTYDMPTLEVRGETFTALEYVTSSGDATVNLGGSRDDQKIVKVGYQVRGTGIADGSYVASVASNTQFELNQNAASSQADTDLTFSEPGTIKLSHPSTHIHSGNTIGKIDFETPLEASGSDAILTGASIHAEAEANFTSSVNSTALVFSTGASEVATEKMRITSAGRVGIGTGSDVDMALHVIGGDETTAKFEESSGGKFTLVDGNSFVSSAEMYVKAGSTALYFQNGSTTNMALDANSRISLSNNDGNTSNTVFGKNAFTNNGTVAGDVGADFNVAIGEDVMKAGTLGNAQYNVGVGHSALNNLTTGDYNISVGAYSLDAITTGASNVAIGVNAASTISTAGECIAIGTEAGFRMSAGQVTTNGTIAIGHHALTALTSGARNTAIGYQSALNNATGTDGTFLGYQSGLNVLLNYNTGVGAYTLQKLGTTGGGGAGENNTAIGALAMSGGDDTVANNTAKNNVAVGYASLGGATKASDGSAFTTHSSTAVGYKALANLAGGNSNLAIGYHSSKALTAGAANITIGHAAMLNATGISSAIFIGANAGDAITSSADPNGTIGIGYDSLTSLTSGARNMAIGYESGRLISTQDDNIFVGFQSGRSATGTGNVALGKYTMYEGGGADNNTAIGTNALQNTTGDNNVAVGSGAMDEATASSYSVAIGKGALHSIDGDEMQNVAIGYDAGANIDHDNADGNVLIGFEAGTGGAVAMTDCVAIGSSAFNSTGNNAQTGTIAIGADALTALTSGVENTAVGFEAGRLLNTGGYNTFLGYEAGEQVTNRNYNVAIGTQAMRAGGADSMIAIGYGTLDATNDTAALGAIGIGHAALGALTSGGGNLAIGYLAGGTISTASFNTYVGHQSGVGDGTQHSRNTGFGYQTLNAATSGERNTAIGNQSLSSLTSGSNNVAVGSSAGTALLAGHSNVIIGEDAYKLSQNGHGVVAIGFEALKSVSPSVSSDQQTVAIGYQAGATINGGANNTLLGYKADVGTNTDSYQTSIGHHGIIKYKTARVTITKAHSGVNSIIAEVCQIPYYSIIHRVSCTVITKSNLGTYSLNLQLSTSSGTDVDGALANASSTITNPEILGASSPSATSQNSATALGTASDIIAGSGATNGTVYTCEPTTTIVGTSDTFLYICNAVDNGTSDSNDVVLEICVEYQSSHL